MIWLFAGIFGICEFGERLRGTFDEINHVYNQFVWYLLPWKVQHIATVLIMVAQEPVQLWVFGSISCCRITLKNVR